MSDGREQFRRGALCEWISWALKHPEYASDALASLTFLHWLQHNKPDLVDFPLKHGEERSQVMDGWLKAAGYASER
jgi:hypothetical protein